MLAHKLGPHPLTKGCNCIHCIHKRKRILKVAESGVNLSRHSRENGNPKIQGIPWRSIMAFYIERFKDMDRKEFDVEVVTHCVLDIMRNNPFWKGLLFL
jgi:hypothetical protein